MSGKDTERIVVVGASAAGLRAAARARRRLPFANVKVLDQGRHISYGACGMPYFVSGDIENANKLKETAYGVIRDPDFFRAAKDIEVLVEMKVERIDREARKVYARSLETGEAFEYPYDKLVLAVGANPVMLPGASKESPRITTFKTLDDAIALRQALQKGEIGKVAVIGGGFIGCEMAEAFASLWGAEVILLEAAPQVLPYFMDREMAAILEDYLREEGVELHLNCPVEEIKESGEGVFVKTGKETFEADCAVVAVGVKPGSGIAADCGLEVGKGGGIKVDERMATSDPHIFAAGDCVEVKHLISKKPLQLPLGSLANRQGRVAGSNVSGGDERFHPVVGSACVKIFDMNVACTGLTEEAAEEAGFDADCAWGTFTDRADYYPESENVHFKLVFEKGTDRLLGLQGFGKGEVVKRVDVFAALLKSGGKLEDLLDAEFAYAPPYAPAVDPLYSLGCAARNAVHEDVTPLPPDASSEGRRVVDVRQAEEAEAAPLLERDALNIPFEEIRQKWEDIPKDKPLTLICAKGLRSAETVRILKEKGISDAAYLGGGTFMRPGDKAP